MPPEPGREYADRLARRSATLRALTAADSRLSAARLAVFGAGALTALLIWRNFISPWSIVLPAAAFGWLLQRHDRVIRAREAAARAVAFYQRGLARIEDRWADGGETGERFRDDRHLYANDLDLFGRGSLFQLLSIARTRPGEETLARWLTVPAASDEILVRRAAVEELTPELDLREGLARAGSEARAGVEGAALEAWAGRPAMLPTGWPEVLAMLLTGAAVAAVAAWIATGQPGPFLAVVAMEIVYSLFLRGRVDHALHAADGPARDLDLLAHVLKEIEARRFDSDRLRALRANLDTAGLPASAAIARLHRLVERHDWQHNAFFALFSSAFLWGTHVAFAIERWRRRHGSRVGIWLDTVGAFEALGSIAAYHYEHPADPFPELIDGPATFDGTQLGHPLVPASAMVRNDVRLDAETRLLIVSGSNMSGKSTLLRTVGVNAVLALAGAPARAVSLRLTPLAPGGTLRIQDSLQEGRSRFYAEITRVRALTDLARGQPPLLFLLDELFHGTNSHDRLAGASGVLSSLLDRGAIGLITTHDLAVTAVADALAARAANVHFQDWFDGTEMRFDYLMKPGPVTHSNALALMRAVGLDVPSAVGTRVSRGP